MKKKILEILDNEVLPINDKDNELIAQQICDLFNVSKRLTECCKALIDYDAKHNESYCLECGKCI